MSDSPVDIQRLTIEFAGDTPIYESESGGWCRYKEVRRILSEQQERVEELEKKLAGSLLVTRLLIERVERDRWEPDKLLCHLQSAKRAALDIALEQEGKQ
jgi:hypothetical protein